MKFNSFSITIHDDGTQDNIVHATSEIVEHNGKNYSRTPDSTQRIKSRLNGTPLVVERDGFRYTVERISSTE